MKRIAPLLTVTLFLCGAVSSPAMAARWQCWAHSEDHGHTAWGKAASEAEAKGLALGNCNGASRERCFISDCRVLGDADSPQRHECIARSPFGGSSRGSASNLNEARGLAKGRCDADHGGGCVVTSCD